MADFYLYLSCQDSLHLRKNNTSSDFWIQLPKKYDLQGQWECALKEITFTCDFKPKSSRLYLCCDILEESYVRETSLPVLRNIELTGRYKKVKSETYINPRYVPIKVSILDTLRVVLKDENLEPVQFSTNDLHCVLHFRRHGFQRSVRL